MTADEFVAKVAAAAPTVDALKALGASPREAQTFLGMFTAKRRARPSAPADPRLGELGTLLAAYDCARLELGMIRFTREPRRRQGAWMVGQVEADPLLVDESTGRIEVEADGQLLWACARSPGSFLEAVSVAAELLGRHAVDEALPDDLALTNAFVARCAAAAGGAEYAAFYRMLFGA